MFSLEESIQDLKLFYCRLAITIATIDEDKHYLVISARKTFCDEVLKHQNNIRWGYVRHVINRKKRKGFSLNKLFK